MGLILNIETATKVCSIAIGKDGKLLDFIEVKDDGYSHSEKLNLLILDLIKKNDLILNDFVAFAISEGPGSYTGLRIGTSTVKGLCYSLEKPLISVNTLNSLCELVNIEKGIKIPLIDARRMEVYTAFYANTNKLITKQHNLVVEENSFDHLKDQPIYLFGNGSDKLKPLFSEINNINFIDNIECSAKGMVKLSHDKFITSDFEDTAYFEPNYGKEFYTTASV